ncbi:substrate-binding domain-containing protein [Nonomuraea sp. 3N208]|uniref:substrate-binding domain-containing protein n=1 Tax=Nonomuraea sp. 3N208 TaxID=3457421 RepID=UPI003FCE37E8
MPTMTAVIGYNWEATLGAMHEARALGGPIPERLSFIMCSNGEPESTDPEPTTATPPATEIANAAFEALIDSCSSANRAIVTSINWASLGGVMRSRLSRYTTCATQGAKAGAECQAAEKINTPLKVVGALSAAGPGAFGLLVQKDSKIQSVGDLKGEKIAANTLHSLGTLPPPRCSRMPT